MSPRLEMFMVCPVAARAAETPNDLAIWSQEKLVSYGEWHKGIDDLTENLLENGVARGSRVAFSLPARPGILTVFAALFRIGAVAFPVDPAFPETYRDALHQRFGCTLKIERTGDAAPERSEAERATVRAPAETRPEVYTWLLEDPATAILTSGSSGEPKIAIHNVSNHIAAARASNRNIPLTEDDTWLLSLPMHHVAGMGVFFRCLVAGARIALPGTMALRDAILQSGATHLSLVPRQLAQLMDVGPVPPLKAILLGGSAIPGPLLDRAVRAGLPIHTSYGMTEMATQIATTPPGASRHILGSSGRPLAAGTLQINNAGLIQVNGPARFLGYWEDGALTRPFDEDGWFTTGDCGHFDADGALHVTGRADNMFVAGGENIQPEEIERALLRLPGISQALVVPVSHPEFGATPVAFVECSGEVDADAIRNALAGVLPRFKVPRHVFPWPAALAGEGMKVRRADFAAEADRRLGGGESDGLA